MASETDAPSGLLNDARFEYRDLAPVEDNNEALSVVVVVWEGTRELCAKRRKARKERVKAARRSSNGVQMQRRRRRRAGLRGLCIDGAGALKIGCEFTAGVGREAGFRNGQRRAQGTDTMQAKRFSEKMFANPICPFLLAAISYFRSISPVLAIYTPLSSS